MTWKDLIKQDDKKVEDEIERILNYHIFGKDDYNYKTEKELESILNESFDFKIAVDYVPDDSAYYIDFKGNLTNLNKMVNFPKGK